MTRILPQNETNKAYVHRHYTGRQTQELCMKYSRDFNIVTTRDERSPSPCLYINTPLACYIVYVVCTGCFSFCQLTWRDSAFFIISSSGTKTKVMNWIHRLVNSALNPSLPFSLLTVIMRRILSTFGKHYHYKFALVKIKFDLSV